MPRSLYPVDWESLATFFARVKRTSKLPAADLAKRLEADGGRFELQFLVPLGPARVDKIEVCDCGGLWIHTGFGWHQAGDFEIRYRPPPIAFRVPLIFPPNDLDKPEPAADDKPSASAAEAAQRANPLTPREPTARERDAIEAMYPTEDASVPRKPESYAEKLAAIEAYKEEHKCSAAVAYEALRLELSYAEKLAAIEAYQKAHDNCSVAEAHRKLHRELNHNSAGALKKWMYEHKPV